MISRFSIVLPAAVLAASLLAPSASAQGRGMRTATAAPRARSSFRLNGREGFARQSRRRFSNDSGFLFYPYIYSDDEIDSGPITSEPPQVQKLVAQPAQPTATAAHAAEPLLMENHGGQWVRVLTGTQMAIQQSERPESPQATNPQSGIAEPAAAAPPLPELPRAVIVFRDGHVEELGKYVIQGAVLSTTADYLSTGSWTRKIPLAELDIPASLKLNNERGAKFSLPSGPNEVVIRF
jgi:hypothetical protein